MHLISYLLLQLRIRLTRVVRVSVSRSVRFDIVEVILFCPFNGMCRWFVEFFFVHWIITTNMWSPSSSSCDSFLYVCCSSLLRHECQMLIHVEGDREELVCSERLLPLFWSLNPGLILILLYQAGLVGLGIEKQNATTILRRRQY